LRKTPLISIGKDKGMRLGTRMLWPVKLTPG
jgi:hypothetical protein